MADKRIESDFVSTFTIQKGLRKNLNYAFIDNSVNKYVFYTE